MKPRETKELHESLLTFRFANRNVSPPSSPTDFPLFLLMNTPSLADFSMDFCHPGPYSLENPNFFRNFCFALTCLELPITSYTMYLLIYHAPPQMKEMKWYLMNLACWTRLMDLMYSFFVIPYFFIPTLVVLPLGAFSLVGLRTEAQLVMLLINIAGELIRPHGLLRTICRFFGLGSSVVLIFENRFNAICPPFFRFKMRRRKVFHSCMFVTSLSLLICSFLKLEDQVTAKQGYLKSFPCPIPEYHTSAFSFKPVSVPLLVVSVFIFSLLILIQVVFFGSFSFYFLYSLERSKMSLATRKLQKKFFLTAWLQILTHLSVIVIPMGYTFFSFLLQYRNQILVNLSTVVITLHGTITSISTIAINRSFRTRAKMWILPKKYRNRRSSTKNNLLTVSSSWI